MEIGPQVFSDNLRRMHLLQSQTIYIDCQPLPSRVLVILCGVPILEILIYIGSIYRMCSNAMISADSSSATPCIVLTVVGQAEAPRELARTRLSDW
jgi:hypothetical protein